MKSYVIDAHGLFWHLTKDRRLGENARAAIRSAEAGEATIFVPVIVLAELFYVNLKEGEVVNFHDKVRELQSSSHFQIMPIGTDHVLGIAAQRLAGVSEMHDCLIAATALELGAELITKDREITKANVVPVIW